MMSPNRSSQSASSAVGFFVFSIWIFGNFGELWQSILSSVVNSGLEFASAFHRLQHRDLIRILNVAAGGNSGRDTRDLQSRPLQQSTEMNGRRFAFDRWIG